MAEHELINPNTTSSQWFTPLSVFNALGIVFDLDPAHPGRDNPHCVVPARRIFTAADDGLSKPWSGRIWLNPPFAGRRGQVRWLKRFFAHGDGVALVAARTSADWFHQVVVPNAEALLFPNGKTKFVRPDGSIGKEPGTGIVLIGMGPVACRALQRSGLGWFVGIKRTKEHRVTAKDRTPRHSLPRLQSRQGELFPEQPKEAEAALGRGHAPPTGATS